MSGSFNESDTGAAIGSYCELQIEASNLANMDVFSLSDPFALLEERRNGKWKELGKSWMQVFVQTWT